MGIYLFDQLIYCSALNMGIYLYVKSVEWYAFIRLCLPLLNRKLENKQGFGVETSINWESRACSSSWGEMGPAHVHSCHPTSGACTTTSLCKPGLTMSQLRNRIRWHGTMDVRFGGRSDPGLSSLSSCQCDSSGSGHPSDPSGPVHHLTQPTAQSRNSRHRPLVRVRGVFCFFGLFTTVNMAKSGISIILVFPCLCFPLLPCVAMNGSTWNLVL